MQVQQGLEASASRLPDKTALVCGGERHSYAEIDRRANQLAHALIAAGVERGDRVVIHLENALEAVIALYATHKAGAVFVILHPQVKPDQLNYYLNNCRASALVCHGRRLAGLEECLRNAPHLKALMHAGEPDAPLPATRSGLSVQSLDSSCSASADPGPPAIGTHCTQDDLAALIYTSGSTGKPKGVMMSHFNMISAAASVIEYLELREDDVTLNVLPLSFSYGLYQVLMAFQLGASVVLERSFAFPYAVIEAMVRERVTGFPLVPSISAILLRSDLRKYDLNSLRYITSAAAALPVAHIRSLREQLPHVKIFAMYGVTECKRASYLRPEQIDVRPDSVGRGIPGQKHYIADESGNPVGPGVVGELVVSGDHVMRGYWEMPEETARALRPGTGPGGHVLYTGDLFRADDEGYLYFVARKDDIIKIQGQKVSPREVEEVLYTLAGIEEAAVLGIPDEVQGSVIKAVLTRSPGSQLTEQQVQQHCAERLETFKVPRLIEFRDQLPRTTSGKIRKLELVTPAP